jgi:uncharacterized protein YndB with AHSA1/START domain
VIETIVLVVVGVVVALLIALLIYAASKPDAFRVQRSATIPAPPQAVFDQIADFHKWPAWSPWEKIDPNLVRTYSGSPSGVGAMYEWVGNKKVGQGRMEIKEAVPGSRVTIQLDFLKPFEAHHTAEFTLEHKGPDTHVTWSMAGRQPFLLKVICTFFSMDAMVGKDFEKGLANLKALAEQPGAGV